MGLQPIVRHPHSQIDSDNERADSLIASYREAYVEDRMTLEEFEQAVDATLKQAQNHFRYSYEYVEPPPPTYVCPWCGVTVTQDRHNFNWWCTSCGKNATDHPDWDGKE